MFRKILVADDGSSGARKAVDTAIAIAARFESELHCISVEEDLPRYVGTLDEYEEVKERRDQYYSSIHADSIRRAAEKGVDLQCHTAQGHEVARIVEYCRDGGFDLLVVGFMGHSGVWGRIWGSTSQNLTRLAPCSVLVVK
ncbi:MAG: universal stress protein [Armatimonadota bacterium]